MFRFVGMPLPTRLGRSETVTPPGCVAALEMFSRDVALVTVNGRPVE
jgi:hypothetical protein